MWKRCFDQSESVQSEEMRAEMVMRCDVKEEDWTWEMAKKEKGVESGQVWGIEVRTCWDRKVSEKNRTANNCKFTVDLASDISRPGYEFPVSASP